MQACSLHTATCADDGLCEQRGQVVAHVVGTQIGLQLRFEERQIELRVLVLQGAADLALLHLVGDVVPVALLQHTHQTRMQMRVGVVAAQALGMADDAGLVLPVDQMPGRQIHEQAAGHRAVLRPHVAIAQQGHHVFEVELAVKVCAANVHAGGGQHIGCAIGVRHALGAQTHDGEVRGAAPHVHHQDRAVACESAFVVQRRRDGFELKRDLLKPHRLRRMQQGVLGLLVACQVVIHKVNGATHHHPLWGVAQGLGGAVTQGRQEGGHDVLKTHQLVVDEGGLVEQGAAQQAFERTHQTPLGAFEVVADGLASEMRAAFFGVVKHSGGYGQRVAFERNQACCFTWRCPGNGGVGGAKVNAERAGAQRGHGCKNDFQAKEKAQPLSWALGGSA